MHACQLHLSTGSSQSAPLVMLAAPDVPQGIQLLQRHGMQPRQWQRNHACKCVAQLLRAHQLVSSGKLWQLHIACL